MSRTPRPPSPKPTAGSRRSRSWRRRTFSFPIGNLWRRTSTAGSTRSARPCPPMSSGCATSGTTNTSYSGTNDQVPPLPARRQKENLFRPKKCQQRLPRRQKTARSRCRNSQDQRSRKSSRNNKTFLAPKLPVSRATNYSNHNRKTPSH